MVDRIYLDHNASCPIHPRVANVMRPLLKTSFGNPSSKHWASKDAKDIIEQARSKVAELIGAQPDEIYFNSGGTESNNTAIKGAFWAGGQARPRIITTTVEHPATLNACRFLQTQGAKLTLVPVDETGRVDESAVDGATDERTLLVTIMHANNEVGTIQPIAEIARACRSKGALLHCDAAQSLSKVPVDVNAMGVDLLSIAGHKLYAPKGVGALYIRRGVKVEPLLHGGGHERGVRAGTESVLMIAGLGAAAELAAERLQEAARVSALRDTLWSGLLARFGDRIRLNGHPEHRLPNTLNVSFLDQVGASVLEALDGVAASTGSACHEGQFSSPVLTAMGASQEVQRGAVRFSLGFSTTEEEIAAVLKRL